MCETHSGRVSISTEAPAVQNPEPRPSALKYEWPERELPPAIKGLDEIEAMQALKAFFRSVRENARKRFDAIGKVET